MTSSQATGKWKPALVFGATGLIGKALVEQLLADLDYKQVITAGRSKLPIKHPALKQVSIDFYKLEASLSELQSDVVFCCLGTTIKKAGSQEVFRNVDFGLPLIIGKHLKRMGATKLLIVSSIGATERTTNFYLKTKGEMEAAIGALGLPSVAFFRPSMLLGPRKEFRLGESIGKAVMKLFSFIMVGKFKKYRAIAGSTVAQAMRVQSKKTWQGTIYLESDEIADLA